MTTSPHDQQETARREDELRDLLVRGMADTTTPVALGDRALAAGRRLRARRRLALAAGALAACSAAALVLPLTVGGAGSARVADPAQGSDTAVDPPAAPEPDDWWTMPATQMLAVVESRLPADVVVTATGPLLADTEEGGPAEGYIVPEVTGPTGPGRVNVMLYPRPGTATDDDSDLACPGTPARRSGCTELRTAGGRLVGRRSTSTTGEVTTLEVVLRRDGGTVYAAAANTLDPKWGRRSPASAAEPPLALDQLEALVRDEAWVSPVR